MKKFYHGRDVVEYKPQHLYNKKTIQLAFDRFGPRTFPVNMQLSINQPQSSRMSGYRGTGSLNEKSSLLPTVPKTPVDRTGINLYAITNYQKAAPQSVSLKYRGTLQSDKSSLGKSRYQETSDNVKPIFMGKRLQQRVNGLLFSDKKRRQDEMPFAPSITESDKSSSQMDNESMSSTEALEKQIFQENNPGLRVQKKGFNKGQRRLNLFQRRTGGNKHSQTEVNDMMAANYKRARKIEQDKMSVTYRSHFNQKLSVNQKHFDEINQKYLLDEAEMVSEPEIYKYIKDIRSYKARMAGIVRDQQVDPEETDVISVASSINLDDVPEHGLVRKYRQVDIQKKKEMMKDLVPEEIEELKKQKKPKVDQKLFKINLNERRQSPKKFVTGGVGYEILQQIGNEKQIKSSIKIEEIKASQFKEFEAPFSERSKNESFYANRRKAPKVQKTQIENSSIIQNYKIFDDLEEKRDFFKLAKENKKTLKCGDKQFIQSCVKMGVTPLPALCKSKKQVQKVLMPTQENKDPLKAAMVQARVGEVRTTLQLFSYYLSESIALAMGKQLKEVDDPQAKTKVLMLDDNGLTDQGLSQILDGLNQQKCLESINISNNEFGPKSQLHLDEIFERCQIQELRLSKIKFLNGKGITQILKSVVDSSFHGLLAIKITSINLHEKQALEYLLEIISKNKLLTDVNLESTSLMPQQMAKLAKTLQDSKSLKWLNLANNQIQPKFEEDNQEFVQNLCQLINLSQVQHMNLSGMAFGKQNILQIIQSVKQSKSLLGVHISNHEQLDQQSFKHEIATILSLNYNILKNYREFKKHNNDLSRKLVNKETDKSIFDGLENKDVEITNNIQYQQEVQKQRQINQFTNFNSKNELIMQNFVLQRQIGHPELKYESVLKNQCEANNLMSTDKWQIFDQNEKSSSCQVSKNCCFLCEKCPYTIFFYQRLSRDENFVQITNLKDIKKLKDTYFNGKATGNLFTVEDNEVIMTGSLVDWDVVKLKTSENYGMEIDQSFYEQKDEEKVAAKKRRDMFRKGIVPTHDEAKAGAKEIGPFKNTKDVIIQQIKEMKKKKLNKYTPIIDDFEKNTSWQDQLKMNLKIQDDMYFINTPDFQRRLAITSKINLDDVTNQQIYVYSDYNIKPGKYTSLVYDRLDDTIWFKTCVVGCRKTQVVEANIKQYQFGALPEKEVCKIKFPKVQYFRDFDIDVQPMPKQLKFELENWLKVHFSQSQEAQEGLSPERPDEEGDSAEDKPPRKTAQQKQEEKLAALTLERNNYLSMLSEIYGLFIFMFNKFSRTSSYPYINRQDFTNVLKLMQIPCQKFQQHFEGEYFGSEIEVFQVLVKMFTCSALSRYLRDNVMPRVGEYLWDHFYDRKLWEHDNRQVMNIIFMNLDVLEKLHEGLKRVKDKTRGFHDALKRHCPAEDWETYRDINSQEYQNFVHRSKLQVTESLAPGIKNTDYVKMAKIGENCHCEMSFSDFMQFFVILSLIQMTNYDFNPFQRETKKYKIGERLKSPLDKVYRFLSFFAQDYPLNIPKIEGYIEHQDSPKKRKLDRKSTKVLSRKSTQKLLAVRTYKQSRIDLMESSPAIRSSFPSNHESKPTESDALPTQEDEQNKVPKNEFVNWNSLNPLLNRELLYEEMNFYMYTDQSCADESVVHDSESENSMSD